MAGITQLSHVGRFVNVYHYEVGVSPLLQHLVTLMSPEKDILREILDLKFRIDASSSETRNQLN